MISTGARPLETLGKASMCKYFSGRQDFQRSPTVNGVKLYGPLQFARANLIPHVFGYFPLDEVGATEPSGMPLEGDLTGPCSARCRGACGPDCPSTCTGTSLTECSQDGGVDQAVDEFECGVHNGCVEHDNCYDACHAAKGCGTWSAAACRRGCDKQAIGKYSFGEAKSWARGGGPFMRTVTFSYKRPAPGACTCVAPGTEVTLDDGTTRRIETLSEGQGVLAFDIDTGSIIKANIERVLVHQGPTYVFDQLRSETGEELELTAKHPVFTLRGFVPTEDLVVGVVGDTVFIVDHIARQTRQEHLISIVRRSSTATATYNLKTTAGNYFAADMLIHNKCLAGKSTVETQRGRVAVSAPAVRLHALKLRPSRAGTSRRLERRWRGSV